MLYKHYKRGYECDMVVVRALCWVYECYVMSVWRAGCTESVAGLLVCVSVSRVWGSVEKLGKGLGQPVEGGSQLLRNCLCGWLIFDRLG